MLLIVLAIVTVTNIISGVGGPKKVETWQIIKEVEQGRAKHLVLVDGDQSLTITRTDGSKWVAQFAEGQQESLIDLASKQQAAGRLPDGWNAIRPHQSLLVSLLISFLPILLIVFLLFFFMNQMQGGGSRVMNFGKSRAKPLNKDMPQTTFADVAGADEAVEELQEIKEFLADPGRFQKVGAKIPKGVLLYGPPGTGKTL
ncbi:MAG: cell division protein FtsH, partial [Actinobacteria bacterium]|nr:cell division protein FtsH [Actinomycetota bacterium]